MNLDANYCTRRVRIGYSMNRSHSCDSNEFGQEGLTLSPQGVVMPLLDLMKDVTKTARRRLGLSPMRRMIREIETHGINLGTLDAVELFAGRGEMQTIDFIGRVRSLEVWELDPKCRPSLERNLPGAAIKIVDTYAEIDRTQSRFNLVLIDNSTFIHGGHCEHFDLLPAVYRLLRDRGMVIFAVIPQIDDAAVRHFSNLTNPEHLQKRREFYGVDDPREVPISVMERTYDHHAESAGFRVDWTFVWTGSKSPVKRLVQYVTRLAPVVAT